MQRGVAIEAYMASMAKLFAFGSSIFEVFKLFDLVPPHLHCDNASPGDGPVRPNKKITQKTYLSRTALFRI